MPSDAPFAHLDATAQAELVRSGEVTPLELVEASIERIEALNPTLNAVIHSLYDSARRVAQSGAFGDGPFRGVPFLVKDAVCHTAGDPYHCGAQFLKDADHRADADTELAKRFRAAGFIFVGKTNTPEFATSPTTEPRAYGPTRNPWNPDHSPGGSSGGSAAAVATGMVPVAHGNDMGGSIRIPASACGLVGLKPTRARNSLAPDFGEYWGPLTHEHVLTRSVRDTAAVLDATAGRATGDPYSAPPPARAWSEEVGVDPGRLRIGFRTALGPGNPAGSDCVDAVEQTAKLLESLGHDVEEVEIPALDGPGFAHGMGVVMMIAVARDLERWSQRLGRAIEPSELEPMNAMFCERGRAFSGTQFVTAVDEMQAYSRDLMGFWAEGWDVLITPTLGDAPLKLGIIGPEGPFEQAMPAIAKTARFTGPFNATGQPAISLPMHQNDGGLPIGVQFVGDYAREDVLIRLASQLEAAKPWSFPEL